MLDEGEMMVHTQSLVSVFRVFESRIRDLEGESSLVCSFLLSKVFFPLCSNVQA